MKKLFKRVIAISMTLTLLFSLTACNTSAPAESSSEATTNKSTTASQVSYPVTITDHLNRSVTLEKQPETLVSGYYITTSLMIALDLVDQLAGVEAKANSRKIYSLSAPEIIDLPNVGTAKSFDLEGCAALNPDLVILPVRLKDSISALEELGINVIAVNPEDQNLLFETIDIISTATNTMSNGTSLKDYITTSLSDLKSTLSNANKPNVYFAGNSSVLTTAGSSMYQNTLLENASATNVAASISDTYWSNVSYEQILQWNPEYIFLASDADYTIESVLSDPALAECNAVKNKQVYQLPSSIESLDSPVPGSFLGSFYIASMIHSDLMSKSDYSNKVTEFYSTYYGFTPEK